MIDMIAQWKNAQTQLSASLGREPTIEEIAQHIDMAPERINVIRRVMRDHLSSSQPISLDLMYSLKDVIEDHSIPRPEEIIFDRQEKLRLHELLDAITEREADVLRMRYGIEGIEPMTLKQVGAQIRLTRERVRQIEHEALDKLHEILTGGDD